MTNQEKIINELDPGKFQCYYCKEYADIEEISQVPLINELCCKDCEERAETLYLNNRFKKTIEKDSESKVIMPNQVKEKNVEFYNWIVQLSGHTPKKQILFFIFNDECINAKLFTKSNVYSIISKVPSPNIKSGYLGCVVSARTPLVGETWVRGNDLSDGPHNENTWRKIVLDIASNEIINLECWGGAGCLLS